MSSFIPFESWHPPSQKIQKKFEEKFPPYQVLNFLGLKLKPLRRAQAVKREVKIKY